MKKCIKCKELKSLDSFHNYSRADDGKQTHCKACAYMYQKKTYAVRNERQRDKRKENWEKVFEYFGGRKCSMCGIESEYPIFDLHHTNPDEKDFNPSRLAHYRWENMLKEVEKCALLCSNCHRIVHYKERN